MNEIINTIWKQISLNTKMACGCRELMKMSEEGLRMRVGGRKRQWVEVTYQPGSDDYKVESYGINRSTGEQKPFESCDGVYCDMLSEVIYHMVNK